MSERAMEVRILPGELIMKPYEIKCDEELNTPEVVARNEIKARIIIRENIVDELESILKQLFEEP